MNWFRVLVFLLVGPILGPVIGARAQIDALPRPDGIHAASFGVSVALGDSMAVVGASGESTCGLNGGAVYVYKRTSDPPFDKWRVTARLTPRPCTANAFFGAQIALSGNRLLVSAAGSDSLDGPGANAAYLFTRTDKGQWVQTARLTAPDRPKTGPFAAGVDLDGDRAVVSTAGNLDTAENGAVYVYDYDPSSGEWHQSDRLTPRHSSAPGVMGRDVALSGDHIAVAASTYFRGAPGSVHVFARDDTTGRWRETAVLGDIDAFFIDLDLHRNVLLAGADRAGNRGAGQAVVFTHHPDDGWTRTVTLHPSQPYESGAFGTSVALNDDWALVTGYGEQLGRDFNIDRVVYAFRRTAQGTWTEHTLFDIGQVDFGAALSVHGDRALISSVPADGSSSVYLVHLR